MNVYDDIIIYVNCSADTKEKITRINNIITALEDAELKAATGSDVSEYWLDDGQTKIKAVLRDPAAIEKAISALIKRRTRLQNICAGYRYGLKDGSVV